MWDFLNFRVDFSLSLNYILFNYMAILDLKDDPHLKILRHLVEAYDAIFEVGHRHIRSMGLTPPQFDVLAELGGTEGMTAVELSNSTLLAKASLTGIADLVTGTDVGECQTEIQSCQGGQFVVTQAAIGPSAEVCNGLDNDCNATVDDQPAADDSCSEGVVCTVDACVAGSCTNTPSDALCSAGETCDGTACVPAVVPCCQQALDAAGWDAPGFVTIDVECQQDGDYHETRTPSSGLNIFFQLVPDTTGSLPRTAFINNGPGSSW